MSKNHFNNYVLALILVFAFNLNYYPHLNYKYPLHVDEWRNYAYSKSIFSEKLLYSDPYLGITDNPLNEEFGFHFMTSILNKVIFLSWIFLLRFLPAIFSVLFVYSIYLFGKELKIGLESAFFAMLIPTSLNLLGPAFFVAVSFALIFVPLVLRSVFFNKSPWQTFIFSLIIIYSHPPTFVALCIILAPFFLMEYRDLFKLKKSKLLRHGAGLLASFILATPLLLPRMIKISVGSGASHVLFGAVANFSAVYVEFGLLITILALFGMYYSFYPKNKKQNSKAFMSLSIAFFILLFLNIVYQFFGKIPLILPTRNYFYMFLLIAFLAGLGFREIKTEFSWSIIFLVGLYLLSKNFSFISQHLIIPNANFKNFVIESFFIYYFIVFMILFMIFIWKKVNFNPIFLVILVLVPSVHHQLNQPYYHIISDQDYNNFLWIKDNLNGTAIIHPWQALAFTPITELKVYSRLPGGPNNFYDERNQRIADFFIGNCTNTTFLKDNNISIIYGYCPNGTLEKVWNNTYLFEPKKDYLTIK